MIIWGEVSTGSMFRSLSTHHKVCLWWKEWGQIENIRFLSPVFGSKVSRARRSKSKLYDFHPDDIFPCGHPSTWTSTTISCIMWEFELELSSREMSSSQFPASLFLPWGIHYLFMIAIQLLHSERNAPSPLLQAEEVEIDTPDHVLQHSMSRKRILPSHLL